MPQRVSNHRDAGSDPGGPRLREEEAQCTLRDLAGPFDGVVAVHQHLRLSSVQAGGFRGFGSLRQSGQFALMWSGPEVRASEDARIEDTDRLGKWGARWLAAALGWLARAKPTSATRRHEF